MYDYAADVGVCSCIFAVIVVADIVVVAILYMRCRCYLCCIFVCCYVIVEAAGVYDVVGYATVTVVIVRYSDTVYVILLICCV